MSRDGFHIWRRTCCIYVVLLTVDVMNKKVIRTILDGCSLETDQYSCRKKGLLKGVDILD